MENNFIETQMERLSLERKVKEWAKRFVNIESPQLKQQVIVEVKNEIAKYPTQVPATQYHLERYERIKQHYMRGKRYESKD